VDKPFDPRVPLLLLLSVTTGLVDAASVLGLGKVFTANMTGNVVFLGFAVAGTPGFAWPPFVVAIVSFMIGALAGGRAGQAHVGKTERRWLLTAALIETSLLWVASFLAIGLGLGLDSAASLRSFVIIALTGAAMGFRNATIRQMKVADLTTTVLTLTLTGLAADSAVAGGANPNWRRRVAAVIAIFVGAAIGAALLIAFGLAAPLAAAGVLVMLGTVGFAIHPAAGAIAKG
jgi:uncharacterized membrane protein YoaK (UPF0700 family)